MVWIDVLCLCLLLYLGEVDSHLLLSWAGSGRCDTVHDIGQTQTRVTGCSLASPSGAAWQRSAIRGSSGDSIEG